ncbi:MAG: SPFH domain-containing protein [Phycisphaerales bacterium]
MKGKWIAAAVLIVVLLILASRFVKTVPAGFVSVATLFGQVQDHVYGEGLHVPVNPFYGWSDYDVRQKTHKETASVPSQDQLTTDIDVSVQYRLNRTQAATIKRETGTIAQVIDVHLIPKLRSVMREQGKSVEKAEQFFLEQTQQVLQTNLTAQLKEYCESKGLMIENVLIRDVRLPHFIMQAIEKKKEREQEAEKQKAELERYKTEQQQKIAQAQAERMAAEEEAKRKRVLADASAYEIEKINQAIADNPAYIQLKAIEALQAISKDPASKIYFLDGQSPSPLPLLHMGDGIGTESRNAKR